MTNSERKTTREKEKENERERERETYDAQRNVYNVI